MDVVIGVFVGIGLGLLLASKQLSNTTKQTEDFKYSDYANKEFIGYSEKSAKEYDELEPVFNPVILENEKNNVPKY